MNVEKVIVEAKSGDLIFGPALENALQFSHRFASVKGRVPPRVQRSQGMAGKILWSSWSGDKVSQRTTECEEKINT